MRPGLGNRERSQRDTTWGWGGTCPSGGQQDGVRLQPCVQDVAARPSDPTCLHEVRSHPERLWQPLPTWRQATSPEEGGRKRECPDPGTALETGPIMPPPNAFFSSKWKDPWLTSGLRVLRGQCPVPAGWGTWLPHVGPAIRGGPHIPSGGAQVRVSESSPDTCKTEAAREAQKRGRRRPEC